MEYKYFKPDEFQLCTPACQLSQMDERLMQMLDMAREICGYPIIINSAYRSKTWELAHKRTGTSSHTKGLAVDISCITGPFRYKLLDALMTVGFTRIGISKSYIHVDIDKDKPNSIWIY